jgi:hypothetical protein
MWGGAASLWKKDGSSNELQNRVFIMQSKWESKPGMPIVQILIGDNKTQRNNGPAGSNIIG